MTAPASRNNFESLDGMSFIAFVEVAHHLDVHNICGDTPSPSVVPVLIRKEEATTIEQAMHLLKPKLGHDQHSMLYGIARVSLIFLVPANVAHLTVMNEYGHTAAEIARREGLPLEYSYSWGNAKEDDISESDESDFPESLVGVFRCVED